MSCAIASPSNSGVSKTANLLLNENDKYLIKIKRSEALFGNKRESIAELNELYKEYSKPNWDGENTAPISHAALITAQNFIYAMPDDLLLPKLLPEFSPEPDGFISVDWTLPNRRIFTLSIGSNKRLAYAWICGDDKGHGVATFDDSKIPPIILSCIYEILD